MMQTSIHAGSADVSNKKDMQEYQMVPVDDLRRLGPKNSLATQQYLCHRHVEKKDRELRKASQSYLSRGDVPGSLSQLALDRNYRLRQAAASVLEQSNHKKALHLPPAAGR